MSRKSELGEIRKDLYTILGAIRLAERVEPDGNDEIINFASYMRNSLELIETALETQIDKLESIEHEEE